MNKANLQAIIFCLNAVLAVLTGYYLLKYGPSPDTSFYYYTWLSYLTPMATFVWMIYAGMTPPFITQWFGSEEERKLRAEVRKAELQKKLDAMKQGGTHE